MYHIKQDKRSQSSAAEIVRGLQECLKTTPLKVVTVSDIHRVTGISRATFYRLFDTPEDVLLYQLDQMTQSASALYISQSHPTSLELLEATISMGLQNHDFLRALVENGRHDLLFAYTEKSLREMDAIKQIFTEDMNREERDFIITHLSMAMVATQITWSRNGQEKTPADLICYLRRYTEILGSILGE